MRYLLLLAALVAAPAAFADEQPRPLKPGPGSQTTMTVCNTCHTSNYIIMNSTFLTPDQWKAEVNKMRHVFGAPMDDAAQAEIAQYLGAHYSPKP